jgi:hypothetical protein
MVDLVAGELDRVHERIAGRFGRAEPRARVRRYVPGLAGAWSGRTGGPWRRYVIAAQVREAIGAGAAADVLVLAAARPGEIVLMHVGSNPPTTPPRSTPTRCPHDRPGWTASHVGANSGSAGQRFGDERLPGLRPDDPVHGKAVDAE